MLNIQFPNPEKYTQITFEKLQPNQVPWVPSDRVLLGIFTITGVVAHQQWSQTNGRYQDVQGEQTYAITARLTDQVIADGLAKAERVDAEIKAAKEEAWRAVEEQRKKKEERGVQIAELTKHLDEERKRASTAEAQATSSSALAATHQERLNKLEGDLAKVKAYFGEKAYNEALASVTPVADGYLHNLKKGG